MGILRIFEAAPIGNRRCPRELRPFLLKSAANVIACQAPHRPENPRLFTRLFVFIVSICIYLKVLHLSVY
jgi:hypothetical protein